MTHNNESDETMLCVLIWQTKHTTLESTRASPLKPSLFKVLWQSWGWSSQRLGCSARAIWHLMVFPWPRNLASRNQREIQWWGESAARDLGFAEGDAGKGRSTGLLLAAVLKRHQATRTSSAGGGPVLPVQGGPLKGGWAGRRSSLPEAAAPKELEPLVVQCRF